MRCCQLYAPLLLLCLWVFPYATWAGTDSNAYKERIPSAERMEELRKESPYDRFQDQEKDEVGERSLMDQIRTFLNEYLFAPVDSAMSSRNFLRYFFGAIGIAAVILFFVRNGAVSVFRGGAVRSSQERTSFTLFDMEEEGPLRKARNAEKEGALIDALRWRYIYIVQCLRQKGLIRKSSHHTDREYLADLKGTGFENAFQKLSAFFQLVRYGDRPLKEKDYEEWKEGFKQLERRIKQYEGGS